MNIPWVEKYRPSIFKDVILDSQNKVFFENILHQCYFPNLLIYGGPGTGKTTTVINLIDAYQMKTLGKRNSSLIIHLNASDERGIDIIRLQINQFVQSKALFDNHQQNMKFIILDEVDYMTKTAQQALRYLLQTYTENVRFCLICNYISRIDVELQNELLKIHFNELPRPFVFRFLRDICEKELLPLDDDALRKIQDIYKSDLRSMINYLQINQDMIQASKLTILHNAVLLDFLAPHGYTENMLDMKVEQVLILMQQYNIDAKSFMKQVFMLIIRTPDFSALITPAFLGFVENAVHNSTHGNTKMYLEYSVHNLFLLLQSTVHAK